MKCYHQINIVLVPALEQLLNVTLSRNFILALSREEHVFAVMKVGPAARTSCSQAGAKMTADKTLLLGNEANREKNASPGLEGRGGDGDPERRQRRWTAEENWSFINSQ